MAHKINENNRMRMRDKVKTGSKKYKNKLMGKDFFVICEDGSAHTVRFFSKDFLHLTGILTDLSEENFFERSVDGTLSLANIFEEQKYDWNTLKGKTNRIEKIDQIVYGNTANSLFMINLHTNTGNYPVAIRNSDINACIGFRDEVHRARTLRKYTNSADADTQQKILAIFGKVPEEKLYGELVYLHDRDLLLEKKKDILELVAEDVGVLICPREVLDEAAVSSEITVSTVDTVKESGKTE